MSVNTKYTDKPNDQYQRANLKGLVGYFHKRCLLYYTDHHADKNRNLQTDIYRRRLPWS
jgi:hypothetical protein